VFNYNFGRITRYTLAGALAGIVESFIPVAATEINGYSILQVLSAVIMASAGFYIAGWLPRFAYIEKAGAHFWKRIEPFGRKLIPVKDRTQAFLFGMVWGGAAVRTGLYRTGARLDHRRCHKKCPDHAVIWIGHFTCRDGRRYNDQRINRIIKNATLQTGRWPVYDTACFASRSAVAQSHGNNSTFNTLER
jgi:Cytochrome C biogenesis protein transmembrane region